MGQWPLRIGLAMMCPFGQGRVGHDTAAEFVGSDRTDNLESQEPSNVIAML